MASNITGQLLGLISAGSAFMGNARREAAMSEKKEQKAKEKAIKQDQKEQLDVAKAENRIAGQEAAREAREAREAERDQDRENKHQQRRQEAMEDFEKKQGIKADTSKTIAENKSQIKQQEEEASGKTAARNVLAAKREADTELTKQKSKLVQEKTRGEKSKRIGTYGEGGALSKSKKAKIQEIAEADAIYQAQQSQEQHTNQKNAVQQLITEAKNIK